MRDIEARLSFHTEYGQMAGEADVRLAYNPDSDEMVLTHEAVSNILDTIADTLDKEVERAKSLCEQFVVTVEHDADQNVLKVGHMEWSVADNFFRAGTMDVPDAWEIVKAKKVDPRNFIVVLRIRGRILHMDVDTIAFALMRPKPPVAERIKEAREDIQHLEAELRSRQTDSEVIKRIDMVASYTWQWAHEPSDLEVQLRRLEHIRDQVAKALEEVGDADIQAAD